MFLEKWNGSLLRVLGQVVGVVPHKEKDERTRIIGQELNPWSLRVIRYLFSGCPLIRKSQWKGYTQCTC